MVTNGKCSGEYLTVPIDSLASPAGSLFVVGSAPGRPCGSHGSVSALWTHETAKSAHDLSRKLGVEMPIVTAVCRVLYEGAPANAMVDELLNRELKAEF